MLHNISSETTISVQWLMRLFENKEDIMVEINWSGMPHPEDILEPLVQIFKDVPDRFRRLLVRQNTPPNVVQGARAVLGI